MRREEVHAMEHAAAALEHVAEDQTREMEHEAAEELRGQNQEIVQKAFLSKGAVGKSRARGFSQQTRRLASSTLQLLRNPLRWWTESALAGRVMAQVHSVLRNVRPSPRSSRVDDVAKQRLTKKAIMTILVLFLPLLVAAPHIAHVHPGLPHSVAAGKLVFAPIARASVLAASRLAALSSHMRSIVQQTRGFALSAFQLLRKPM